MSRSLSGHLLYYLAPTLFSPLLSIVVLPLATRILNPEDYAVAAILGSIATIISSMSALGGGLVWTAWFLNLDEEERGDLVSTWCSLALVTAVCLCILAWWGRHLMVWLLPNFPLSPLVMSIALAQGLLLVPWSTAAMQIFLCQMSTLYSRAIVAAALASTLTLLAGLFVFHLGPLALYLSGLASSVVFCLFSLFVFKGYLRPVFSRRWAGEILRLGLPAVPTSLMEYGSIFIERLLLGSRLSLRDLGLYTHSQNYRSMFGAAIRSLGLAILPVSLREARDSEGNFPVTAASWNAGFGLMVVAAIGSFALGREIVALLTNDKFTAAAPLITAWIGALLLLYTGREATAILLERKATVFFAYSGTAADALFLGLLFLLTPVFGLWGAVAAEYLRRLAQRLLLTWKSRRFSAIHTSGAYTVYCFAMIVGVTILQVLFKEALILRCVLSLVFLAVHLAVSRKVLTTGFTALRSVDAAEP